MKAHGVPFHIIAVITADTLAFRAEEYLSHFVELGSTELCFNIDEQEGLYSRSTLNGKIEEYHIFINELRSAQKSSHVPISIREFDSAAAKILTPPATYHLGGKSLPFNSLVVPFSIFSVAVDGSFSTFSPELLSQREKNGFKFGNVWSDDLQNAIANPDFRETYAEILSGIGSCLKSCRYFEWCGGGAPSNKLYENGSFNSTETNYCKMTFQIPFDLVLGELEHYLEERSAHM